MARSPSAPPSGAGSRSGSAPKGRRRLDERLVADGLAESRTRAQALIRMGRVLVADVPVEKPGTSVRDSAAVRVRGETLQFVSRGGDKLAGALEDLSIDPGGRQCLDVGASTGGFTDCLLQRGATHVVAVDVGYGQLHPRLRTDARVAVLERTNFRTVPAERVRVQAEGAFDLVVMDVSFISAARLLDKVREVAENAELLVLVKPQFEVGRGQVGKGGVVRDDELRLEAAAAVTSAGVALGWRAAGQSESRLAGPRGNREIFVRLLP